jgi:hypothetical protein
MTSRNLCALLVWLVVALLAWLDYAHPLTRQPVDAAFLGFLIGALISVFSWLADKAVTVGYILWQVAVIVGQAIARSMVVVATVLSHLYRFLAGFWSAVLKPFVSWVWREFLALHAWLKATFQPALEFLWKVRAKLLELYTKYMRPVLDTIEITRRLLQLLATLRIEWARTLDRKLAELEYRLTLPLLEALKAINLATNWINRIVDFDGFFQRVTLIQSLLRYERDMWKVWWTSVRGREAEKGKVPPGAVVERTPAAAAGEVIDYLRGQDVPGTGAVEELAATTMAGLLRASP